jgi:cytochrome c biogenesis protein CcmG/thiol:disulfide interchange protein DsbE
METEKSNKNPFWTFLFMAVAVVVFAAVGSHLFKSRSANLVGTKAPPVQLNQWITSQPPDLTGRVYVLDFWATWCPPCVQSIPHMIELANKYKEKAVPFIAISVDNSSEPVKKMVKSKGINYYVGMDNGLSDKYSISSIPSAFIIGRSGKVVWEGHPMSPDFESALVNALNTPPPSSSGVEQTK